MLLALTAWAYARAGARVPGFARARRACFAAGLAALALALVSPVATYADALFWVHMVQHLLVTLVAAPLLVLGAPVALALRAARPATRARAARVARSGAVRALSHPVVTWSSLPAVLWASHFSPLYDRALDSPPLHALEHALYLAAALLFWWPVAAADPGARRVPHAARVAYVALALPAQSFLGLALYSASDVLYRHYATLARPWGPSPADDQRLAALVMWLGGDPLLVAALMGAAVAWMRHDERVAARLDRRAARGDPSPRD